ncbi:MAG TPA: hypothetical protein VN256_25775 [Pyrinomonadaceae bacterium]|nr:hypothetical protein [Pyrinomonadaceae bacterium]
MSKGEVFNELLSRLNIHPVLIDIGSSGAPPEIWDPIARHSVYVGFDPDLREMHEVPDGRFRKAITVNEAVMGEQGGESVTFYLTRSPYCSSTLKPDLESLSNFLFSDLFVVEREASVKASTLNSILDRLSLDRVDWFKTDSQGIDLRLFNSLRDEVRSRVLAVDIEPGLISAYLGEDTFVDVHRSLTREGFWLSNVNVCGTVRMRQSALAEAARLERGIDRAFVEQNLRKTPGWCEARYLRTIESLPRGGAEEDRRDYVLLWTFSLIDEQFGFALDVGMEYEKVFGADDVSRAMKAEAAARIKRARPARPRGPSTLARAKSLVPAPAKRLIKKIIR